MTTFLFEHMIRVEVGDYICRIWREERNPSHDWPYIGLDDKHLAVLAAELLTAASAESLKTIVTAIAETPRVNSVEIIHKQTGNGICVHKDWP